MTAVRNHWPVSILFSMASIFNVILPIVLASVFAQKDYGIYKIFFLYLMLAPGLAFTVGLTSGLPYWAGQGERGLKAIRVTSWIIFLHALVFMLLLTVFANPLVKIIDIDGFTKYTLYLMSLAIIGEVAGKFFEEAAISVGKGWRGSIFYAGFEIVRTFVIVFVAWQNKTVESVFQVQVAFSLLKTAFGYFYAFRLKLAGFLFDWDIIKAVNRYALPVSAAGVLTYFINYADQFLLTRYISPEEFATYAVGCFAIAPLFMFEYSVARVMIPELSSSFARQDGKRAAAIYKITIEQLALILVPAAIGLSVFADGFIALLFPKYPDSVGYLRLFAFSYFLLIFPNDLVPRAKGQSRWIFCNFTFFSLLSIAVCATAAYFYGAYGALVGILLTRMVMRLYGLWYAKNSCKWGVLDFIPVADIAHLTTVCLLLSGLSLFLKQYYGSVKLWTLEIAPLFTLLYFISFIFWKLPLDKKAKVKRIVMVCQVMGIGGLERVILELSRNLHCREDVAVSVFCYDALEGTKSWLVPFFEEAGIEVTQLKKGKGFSFKALMRLVFLISSEKVVVLHSHDIGPMIYAVLAKILSPRRVRVVHTEHTSLHLLNSKRYQRYERFFSLFVDDLVAVSEECKRNYEAIGVSPSKVTVLGNGVECIGTPENQLVKRDGRIAMFDMVQEEAREQLVKFKDSFWLINVARINPEKGQLNVFALWNLLPDDIRSKCAVLFVGPDGRPEYVQLVYAEREKAKDKDRIIFVGAQPNPLEWYAVSDICLSLSSTEGHPLSPIEALGAGVPAVLSDIEGHAFIKDHAKVFKLSDLEAGAKIVTELIRELERCFPDLLPNAEDSVEWTRKNFSVEKMADNYYARYLKVLGL